MREKAWIALPSLPVNDGGLCTSTNSPSDDDVLVSAPNSIICLVCKTCTRSLTRKPLLYFLILHRHRSSLTGFFIHFTPPLTSLFQPIPSRTSLLETVQNQNMSRLLLQQVDIISFGISYAKVLNPMLILLVWMKWKLTRHGNRDMM